MNMFLLYLIHTFTRDNPDNVTSVAFLQTEGEIRELVQDHVELNEESRAKKRFKYQLIEYLESIMQTDQDE